MTYIFYTSSIVPVTLVGAAGSKCLSI